MDAGFDRVRRLAHFLVFPGTETGLRARKGFLLALLGIGFVFLYVVAPTFDDWRTDVPRLLLPIVVVAALGIVLLARDPLLDPRALRGRHAAFFESQVPRVYIQERCGLPAAEARRRWLEVLHQWQDGSHPKHMHYAASLKRRYECRAIYYLQWLSIRLSLLSLLALAVLAGLTWAGDLDLPRFYSLQSLGLTAGRIAFPLFFLVLYLYLRLGNRPDAAGPTGVWLSWKETNDILKEWWDRHQAGG